MIDLRNRDLPDRIECCGRSYRLKTDFRDWICFDHDLQHHGICNVEIFVDKPTGLEVIEPLMEFYRSPNITPTGSSSSERIVDMVWDGDYIVASFMQAYGIDLTTVDYMHWHVFKALLYNLPDDTVMSRIMGYRSWQKSNRKIDDVMADRKRRYSLPTIEQLEERRTLLKWAEEMGL